MVYFKKPPNPAIQRTFVAIARVGAILKVARRYEADLIILVSRERGAWARLLFGPSTAERVTREAESPVMVLRGPMSE